MVGICIQRKRQRKDETYLSIQTGAPPGEASGHSQESLRHETIVSPTVESMRKGDVLDSHESSEKSSRGDLTGRQRLSKLLNPLLDLLVRDRKSVREELRSLRTTEGRYEPI